MLQIGEGLRDDFVLRKLIHRDVHFRLRILHGLKGINIVGGDVVEVAPQYDSGTNTAQAGAQMLFEILSLMVFSPSIGKRRG